MEDTSTACATRTTSRPSRHRRSAGNGEGVALSVGRDMKNAEHVHLVLFDEDLWNATSVADLPPRMPTWP